MGVASAAYLHTLPPERFGIDGTSATDFRPEVGGIGIDQTRQRLYVFNNERTFNHSPTFPRLYGFDISASGGNAPLGGFPVGAPEAAFFPNPQLAVDNSGGAPGHIYTISYTSTGGDFNPLVRSFDLSGSPRPGFPVQGFSVAVDSDGHVWNSRGEKPLRLEEHDADGTLLGSVGTFDQGGIGHIAFDGADNLYAVSLGSGNVWRYTAASNYKAASPFIAPGGAVDIAFDRARSVLYAVYQESVVAYNIDGDVIEVFGTGLGSGLHSLAVDESTGDVYLSQDGAGEAAIDGSIWVFPAAAAADVSTGGPTSDNAVSGHVDPAGGGDVSACSFQFGTTKAYGSTASCLPAIPPAYSGPVDVSAELPGMVPETTYHYRLTATNDTGTNVGRDGTITPHHVHRIETEGASGIGRSSATLHGSFEGNGDGTHYYFEWGTTTAYGATSAVPPGTDAGSPTGHVPLSFGATGLQPGTTYHYRVVGKNSSGISYADDEVFTTLPAVQDISTDPVSNLGPRSATLNASFTGTSEDTQYHFEWGTDDSYGNETPEEDAGVTTGPTPLSADIAGLELETAYHYRVVATNGLGTSYGPDRLFITRPAVAGVSTDPASAVTLQSVQLNGSFEGNGQPTSYYFEWGSTTAYGQLTAVPPGVDAGAPSGPTAVSAELSDFIGYSTYHYRLVAVNSFGVTYGKGRTFTTVDALAPAIDFAGSSGVSPTSARVDARITPNRWQTVYLFEYGPTTRYGASTPISDPIGDDLASHAVSEQLHGLQPATLYHFRVVAINFAGTSYGPDRTFVTPDRPSLLSAGASAVGQRSAHLAALVTANGSPTEVRFEYGPTGSYGQGTGPVPIGAELLPREAGVDLSGLEPGTTYHFRAVAVNGIASSAGADLTFTTQPMPVQAVPKKPKKCKKGFVKRGGKCVKKRKNSHKQKRHRGGRNG